MRRTSGSAARLGNDRLPPGDGDGRRARQPRIRWNEQLDLAAPAAAGRRQLNRVSIRGNRGPRGCASDRRGVDVHEIHGRRRHQDVAREKELVARALSRRRRRRERRHRHGEGAGGRPGWHGWGRRAAATGALPDHRRAKKDCCPRSRGRHVRGSRNGPRLGKLLIRIAGARAIGYNAKLERHGTRWTVRLFFRPGGQS
jgi:hypothetical protein